MPPADGCRVQPQSVLPEIPRSITSLRRRTALVGCRRSSAALDWVASARERRFESVDLPDWTRWRLFLETLFCLGSRGEYCGTEPLLARGRYATETPGGPSIRPQRFDGHREPNTVSHSPTLRHVIPSP